LAREENTVIGQSSRVSVALLAMIFTVTTAAAAGGARWATRIETRLESIEKSLDGVGGDRWTESDMKSWASALENSNPSVRVPDVKHQYLKDGGG
jgi:hypothetical protein